MRTAAVTSETARGRLGGRLWERVGWPELVLIGLLILIARRPEAILAAEFTWEEANAFYVPTFFMDPLAQLTEPWGGSLQFVPRLGYFVLRAVPVYWAPLAENLLALAALLAVAAFIASRRLAGVVPDWRVRIALAAMVILLPAQRDVMGALMNSQWYAGLWFALLPVAAIPITAAGRWAERVAVGAVALTGPFSILLAPVYAWRVVRRRDAHHAWLAAIVLVGGLAQVLSILGTGRVDVAEPRPIELAIVTFLVHGAIVPVIGERLSLALGSAGIPGPILLIGGGAMIASLIATAWRVLPIALLPIVYSAVAIAASGVAVHGGASVWPPGVYERYFLAIAVVVAGIVLGGLVRQRRLAVVLGILLGVGIISDFRLEPYPAQGWDLTHACIGSADPCVVPIWPHDYDVHWPGIGGEYRVPEHVDP